MTSEQAEPLDPRWVAYLAYGAISLLVVLATPVAFIWIAPADRTPWLVLDLALGSVALASLLITRRLACLEVVLPLAVTTSVPAIWWGSRAELPGWLGIAAFTYGAVWLVSFITLLMVPGWQGGAWTSRR